jgi:hypothetical protein
MRLFLGGRSGRSSSPGPERPARASSSTPQSKSSEKLKLSISSRFRRRSRSTSGVNSSEITSQGEKSSAEPPRSPRHQPSSIDSSLPATSSLKDAVPDFSSSSAMPGYTSDSVTPADRSIAISRPLITVTGDGSESGSNSPPSLIQGLAVGAQSNMVASQSSVNISS